MAYVPSNAPIGPNSLLPAECVNDALIAETNGQAALGRLATFLTSPPSSSFDNLTLAVDAARILQQSREGRGSILSANGPQPNQHVESVDLRQWVMDAPELVPLNERADSCGGSIIRRERPAPAQMIMPVRAPVAVRVDPVYPTVLISPQFAPPQFPAPPPVYSAPPSDNEQTFAAPPSNSGPVSLWSAVSMGPGGPGATNWAPPAAGPVMQDGGIRYMGYSGYAPPWGDAGLVNASELEGDTGGGWFRGLMLLGGLVLLGGAVTGGVKRARGKRRFRR